MAEDKSPEMSYSLSCVSGVDNGKEGGLKIRRNFRLRRV